MRKENGVKSGAKAKRLLILLVSGIIAIALGLTCALCIGGGKRGEVGEVGTANVSTSANKSLTAAGPYDYTIVGQLSKNDIIDMAYCGGIYDLYLPRGIYKLEVWGAQGGGYTASNYGGYGGYTYGQIEFTTQQHLYVCIGKGGGFRTQATTAPYNGGGKLNTSHYGGSGGGATHMATVTGVLSSLSAGNNNILIVAGGGGGVGCGCNTSSSSYCGVGGGGNNSGGSAPANHHSTNRGGGSGGTTAKGGAGGKTATNGGANAGTFGKGGNQTSPQANTGGGGGGGGYYGGGSGGSDTANDFDDGSGGGGSGYINTGRMTAGTYGGTSGSWGQKSATSYNGKARITAIQVNQVPTATNTPVNIGARGTDLSVSIAASTIAQDPDFANYTGGAANKVYFTDGTSSNQDTITKNDNNILLENGQSAKDYFDWTIDKDNITLTAIKRYPRKGVDGSTQNDGTLKLKVKVRDDYGSNTTRGVDNITFNVTIEETAPQKRMDVELNADNDDTDLFDNAYLGDSKVTDSPENSSITNIYNPNGANRYSAQIVRPLRLVNSDETNIDGVKVRLNAADIMSGVSDYDAVYFSIGDTSQIDSSFPTRIYSVEEVDAGSGANVTLADGTRIPNAYTSITLIGRKAEPTYQVLPVTVYVIEKAINRQLSFVQAVPLDLVFKIDNTRPVIKENVDPLVTLGSEKSMERRTVSLDEFYSDIDGKEINSSTHKITEVKVPLSEFVLLDKYGKIISTVGGDGKSYFNLVDPGDGYPTQDKLSSAMITAELSPDASAFGTGFSPKFISTGAEGSGSETAYIQYSFTGSSLTLSGRRATHSMYKSTRSSFRSAIGGGIDNAAGLTEENCTEADSGKNLGDFYILIHVQDMNDVDDEGIWLPLAIRVLDNKPTEMNTEGDVIGASAMPTAFGSVGDDPVYFTPMGITFGRGEDAVKPIGFRLNGKTAVHDLKPLASDPDNYYTSSMLGSSFDINELLTVTSSAEQVNGSVSLNINSRNETEYFEASLFDVYVGKIDNPMFGGRINAAALADKDGYEIKEATVNIDGTDEKAQYVVVKGIKITFKNATHNRYLYASASVADITGSFVNARIAIKVENTTPNSIANESIAKINYSYNGKKVKTEYSSDSSTVTYSIPRGSSVVITPYDFLSDADMERSGAKYPKSGFTLNGLSGRYNSGTGTFSNSESASGDLRILGIGGNYNLKSNGGLEGGVDYGSVSYRKDLATALTSIGASIGGGKRTFIDTLSATNTFADAEKSFTTNIDRLYFARTSDSSHLDAGTFDPYSGGDYGTLASPVTENDSFVDIKSGTKLVLDGKDYNIDFFVITATTRTPDDICPQLTFTIRDGSGAGATGNHVGLKQITVKIDIVNSTPYLYDADNPDFVYTLATAAVSDTKIQFPTLEIFATDILKDNEEEPVAFYLGGSNVSVLDGNNKAQDENENYYLGKYFTVSLTADKMTITALNSTQNITSGLYLTFYATDGRSNVPSEQSTLKIQIEVLNSAPKENTGANGLDFENLFGTTEKAVGNWTVNSFDSSDMKKTRFFASSDTASKYLKDGVYKSKASSDQVKVVVSDTDALQGAVLAPVISSGSNNDYINAPLSGTDADKYKNYVPLMGTGDTDQTNPYAVQISFVDGEGQPLTKAKNDITSDEAVIKYVSNFGIVYFVKDNNNNVTAHNVEFTYDSVKNAYAVKGIADSTDTTIATDKSLFFDKYGRWTVKDWAVYVTPNEAFMAGTHLKLTIGVRDDSDFGGDTAGRKTALSGNAKNIIAEDGSIIDENLSVVNGYTPINCYMFVKDTGIRTLDYYDRYNNYYTVTDTQDSSKVYIPTFDENPDSILDSDVNIFRDKDGKIVNEEKTGNTEIKKIASGNADKTNAGIHSGMDYSEEFDGIFKDSSGTVTNEKPFRYSHTIRISGDKNKKTYIPMSYLAMRQDFVEPANGTSHKDSKGTVLEKGTAYYAQDKYIGYNVKNNAGGFSAYTRSSINDIASAIKVYDGTTEYTGSTLKDNPYVAIAPFDLNLPSAPTDAPNEYLNSPYLNHVLHTTTIDGEGKSLGYEQFGANTTNFVRNGHIMYLAQQLSSLQEHRFGLAISKKDTRASVSKLTITISVATCIGVSGTGDTKVNFNKDADASKFTADVTLNLEIGNSPITLSNTENATTDNFYSVNMYFNTGDPAQGIVLSREESSTSDPSTKTVIFNDEDRSDSAYFYSDSLYTFSKWNGKSVYKRTYEIAEGAFANTASDTRAQGSMERYFRREVSVIEANIGSDFKPNEGIYGTNAGYDRYFSVNITEGGTRLSVAPLARTVINPDAVKGDITDFYNERGLEPIIDDTTGKVTSAYYPLRVLVYDSSGDGFGVASYVCLEIRVFIGDTAPILSKLLTPTNGDTEKNNDPNRTINYKLAVGTPYTFSLKDVIVDPDVKTNKDTGELFFKNDFEKLKDGSQDDKFVYETGNYLCTPYGAGWENPTNDDLHKANPVITSLYDQKTSTSVKDQPDIIMMMEYNGDEVTPGVTEPSTNTVTIRVNRRTMYREESKNGIPGAYKQQTKFKFLMTFTDSYITYEKKDDKVEAKYKNVTGTLTINVEVANKAPYMFDSQREYAPVNNVKMRVGDSFVAVATPSDYFNGEAEAISSSVSAQNSVSYSNYASTAANTVLDPMLMRDSSGERTGNVKTYLYNALTIRNLNSVDAGYRLRDARPEQDSNARLGYIALANDDAPWSLRIKNVVYDMSLFTATARDRLENESAGDGSIQLTLPFVYNITAKKSCVNAPITFVVCDSEGETYEYTMYVTVESTPPRAIYDGFTRRDLNEGLLFTEESGTYDLYMRVAGDGNAVEQINLQSGGDPVNAYSSIDIDVKNLAYDPDGSDDDNIAMFVSNKEVVDGVTIETVPQFAINGTALSVRGNVYYNDKYEITLDTGEYKTFTIKCKAYEDTSNIDVLRFFVRDVGNPVFDNALEIKIRITTLYSSLSNADFVLNSTSRETSGSFVINKADTVHVKAKDVYRGVGLDENDPRRGQSSTYQFLDYANVPGSVDQNPNDSRASIVDPDIAVNNADETAPIPLEELNYDLRVYAFMDSQSGGEYASLGLGTVSRFFTIVRDDVNLNRNFFYLDRSQVVDLRAEYLVGGRTPSGGTYANTINKKLLQYINNYFRFSIGADGVSLEFQPVTANINKDILFYVELEKQVGAVDVRPSDATSSLIAGSLFYVSVDDSAPIGNKDVDAMSFVGSAVKPIQNATGTAETVPSVEGVNSFSFKIFGADHYTSMFTDSDAGDYVTVDEFKTVSDYERALGDYFDICKQGANTSRALDLIVKDDMLTVKINRRIDYDADGDGKLDNAVTIPIKVVGRDIIGKAKADGVTGVAETTLYITVVNNDLTIDLDNLPADMPAEKDFSDHSGYKLSALTDSDAQFLLQIETTKEDGEYDSESVYHAGRRTYDVIKWLSDPDFTTAIKDTDSFRLVASTDQNAAKYLIDEPLKVYSKDDPKELIATLNPVFKPDAMHFTGFTVTAESYGRNHIGIAYLRILDRSGDETDVDAGTTIRVEIKIGNSEPKVKEGMKVTEYEAIVGSMTNTLDAIEFDISKYVEDKNSTDAVSMKGKYNTYLRVINTESLMPEEIYATATSGDVSNVVVADYEPGATTFTVKPVMGVFGKQTVRVKVCDGASPDGDSAEEYFDIKFNVIFNFGEVVSLLPMSAVRGITEEVTADELIQELDNTAGGIGEGDKKNGGISQSAAGDEVSHKFNPGKDYVVSNLSVSSTYAAFVSISAPDESNENWRFTPLRTTTDGTSIPLNVTFTLRDGINTPAAQSFSKTFQVTIGNNPEPTILELFRPGKTYTFNKKNTAEGAVHSRYDLDKDGSVLLAWTDLFKDNEHDVVSFIRASSDAPTLVSVQVVNKESLKIKFNCSGTATIHVTVADLTGEEHTHTLSINNNDCPEPTFMQGLSISFETNKMMWFLIIGGIVLAIIILIIVIIAVKHRKRKREELEAMLVSEMELEEQMMRLAAAPGPAQFNSYGFLPPTVGVQNDPGMLLGTGTDVGNTNTLNLNPGQNAASTVDLGSTNPTIQSNGMDGDGGANDM